MDTIVGICKYCGNKRSVIAATQENANEIISHDCGCAQGRVAEKKKSAEKRIELFCGPECADMGFTPVLENVICVAKDVSSKVIDGMIQEASFKIDGTTLSIKGGAKVKISRKYTYEQSEEIE